MIMNNPLLIFCGVILIISLMRYLNKLGNSAYATLLVMVIGILGALLGVSIDWKNKTFKPNSVLVSTVEERPAYGLKVHKIISKHYYLTDGNFLGEKEYLVENVSKLNITDLLPDKAGWFGATVKCELKPIIYNDEDRGKYNLSVQYFSTNVVTREDLSGNDVVTMFHWQLKVTPGLSPGTLFHYGVQLLTQKTEHAAFTESGTFAGEQTPFLADELEIQIYPPEGYRLMVVSSAERDTTGIQNNDGGEDKGKNFQVLNNGAEIVRNIKNPIPNVQYLVRISLVHRN